jgi:hypothetical protein
MSCLFQSLSFFMINNNPDTLRQDICNYLDLNPNLVDNLTLDQIMNIDGVTKEQYIAEMRKNSTWGGAIEIKAFCDIYHINVEVIILNNGIAEQKTILFQPDLKPCNRLLKITWNGNHFEPLPNL